MGAVAVIVQVTDVATGYRCGYRCNIMVAVIVQVTDVATGAVSVSVTVTVVEVAVTVTVVLVVPVTVADTIMVTFQRLFPCRCPCSHDAYGNA